MIDEESDEESVTPATCCEAYSSCTIDCISRLHWHDQSRQNGAVLLTMSQFASVEAFEEARIKRLESVEDAATRLVDLLQKVKFHTEDPFVLTALGRRLANLENALWGN